MNDVLRKIGELGIVPVVKIEDADLAIPLGKALVDGGLPIAEITFRTACAEEAIKKMTVNYPQMLIGAGTVLTVDQAERAAAAGARFIVSPGLNPKVVGYCVDNDIPITPGCSSPTDIETALGFGLDVVKFFPAEASGGLAALKAISAPYGMVRYIPTGGINAKNLESYLGFSKVLACGGSWMVDQSLLSAGRFDEVTRLASEAVGIMLGFELAHVGINMPDPESSLELASQISGIFGMQLKEGNSSNMSGSVIEVTKKDGPGEKGHIAIKTNDIRRAISYLGSNGAEVDMDTVKGTADKMIAVYLKESFGGFAIHLLQK